jgi:hypothetical protein
MVAWLLSNIDCPFVVMQPVAPTTQGVATRRSVGHSNRLNLSSTIFNVPVGVKGDSLAKGSGSEMAASPSITVGVVNVPMGIEAVCAVPVCFESIGIERNWPLLDFRAFHRKVTTNRSTQARHVTNGATTSTWGCCRGTCAGCLHRAVDRKL